MCSKREQIEIFTFMRDYTMCVMKLEKEGSHIECDEVDLVGIRCPNYSVPPEAPLSTAYLHF